MREPGAVEDIARAVARFGSPSQHPVGPLVPGRDWSALWRRIVDQRLTGLAMAASRAGVLVLSEDHREELRSSHRDAMVWALTLERELLSLHRDLRDAGVEPVVLKGPALAHTLYPDPAWRDFGDLDLLVRADDWSRACAVLSSRGFRRSLPQPRPGFDERFGKAATHVDESGLQIDLHRRMTVGAFGLWVDPGTLADRAVPFVVGGRELLRLDDSAALLHACLHASLGSAPARLLPLRDVVQIAHCGTVDWGLLTEWSRRWRLRAVVRHAFRAAAETLEAPLPAEALSVSSQGTSARERRALAAHLGGRRERGGPALSVVGALPGVRMKAAYVRALVFPEREFLVARARGEKPSYVRRWTGALRWAMRRPG